MSKKAPLGTNYEKKKLRNTGLKITHFMKPNFQNSTVSQKWCCQQGLSAFGSPFFPEKGVGLH